MAASSATSALAQPTRGDDIVVVPPQRTRSDARAAKVIFLDRCRGGCVVNTDGNRAQTNSSTIPKGGSTLSEFGFGDSAWTSLLSCVQDLYQPYDIVVTDVKPDDATAQVKVLVAGVPSQLGLDANTLGIAPLTSDCSPQRNVIAFAFAGAHSADNLSDLCSTAAHEAGHVFGLDHAFECRDPMTYLTGCGQKYFLNFDLPCGEFMLPTRACKCGAKQNSHEKLTRALDQGALPTGPAVNIIVPTPNSMVMPNFVVTSKITEKRWLSRAELWINGWPYAASKPGASSAPVILTPPRTLSDGVLDIEVRAYDDLGTVGVSRLTVTKGAPCADASTCAAKQSCDNGRCSFAAPTLQLGDTCSNNDECVDHQCVTTGGGTTCSKICVVGVADQCGSLECVSSVEGYGLCVAPTSTESGGCCGVGGGTDSGWIATLWALLVSYSLLARRGKRIEIELR
jgi:hypothetical protein